jgi:preprotein translocase subunit SecB
VADSKRKSAQQRGELRPSGAAPPPKSALSAGEFALGRVSLKAVGLRGLSYEEIDFTMASEADAGSARVDQRLPASITGSLSILNARQTDAPRIELTITMELEASGAERPVEVRVTVAGLFHADETVSMSTALAHVNTQGPRMLFPYLREIVTSVTQRGIFGAVYLEPIILGPMIEDAEVEKALSRWTLSAGL